MKLSLTNTSAVEIGGKRPGAVFAVDADDEGVPFALYWRKRLADGSVIPTPADPPAAPVPRAASPKPAKSKE